MEKPRKLLPFSNVININLNAFVCITYVVNLWLLRQLAHEGALITIIFEWRLQI